MTHTLLCCILTLLATPRTCQRCEVCKPIIAFYLRRYKNGRFSYLGACKQCQYRYSAKPWNLAHKTEHRRQQRAWRLTHKEQINAQKRADHAANPEKARAASRKWHARNRERENARSAAFRATYPALILRICQAWRKRNPLKVRAYCARRRARLVAAAINDLTAQDWEDICRAFNHRCAYCKKKVRTLTRDHLTPLSKGGNNTKSNVVPACQSCNSRKRAGDVLTPVQPLLL